jgi:Uma2 family endonuclease
MGSPAEKLRRAGYEDVLAAPPHMVAEVVDGVLYTSPRPSPPHAVSSSELGADLTFPFGRGRGGPGGWWILFEPELHLGEDIVVPDLAGWRRERMPRMPETAFFTQSPDWLCEVVSPKSARHDRIRKMGVYLKAEVGHVWLVDPLDRTLEVFRREGLAWLRVGAWDGDPIVRAEPFDAIELDLLPLWGERREPESGPGAGPESGGGGDGGSSGGGQ